MNMLRLAIFALLVSILLVPGGSAQTITGTTTIDIDPDTGYVTAACETDLDADTAAYYEATVTCRLYGNGVYMGTKSASDTRGISGTTFAVFSIAAVPGTTYTAIGTHGGIISYQQEEYGEYEYNDEFNFESFQEDPATYEDTYDWIGPGPPEGLTTSSIQTGKTTATKNYPKATITLAFTGSKNQQDHLLFSNGGVCSENLGILFCPNPGFLQWSLEVNAAVSDDASKWIAKQQFVSGAISGNSIDGYGVLHPFSIPQVAGDDSPVPAFVQQTSGSKNVFWLDSPGIANTLNNGQSIDSMTFIQNFSGQVCSTVLTSVCSPSVNWYVKIILTPGGHLDTTNSTAALGTASF